MPKDENPVDPTAIRLEASSFCQLRCPSCPTATRAIEKHVGYGFLTFENFKKLVDENPQLRQIELSNYGEIFLNPHLKKIFEHAFEKKVHLTAFNGVNLNHAKEDVLESLVEFQVRGLTVSLDGASQESYEKYRVKGNFRNAIKNIETINRWKKKYNSIYPKMNWQFVAFGHNEHEIDEAERLAGRLGMSFHLKLSWDDDLSPIEDREALTKRLGYSSRKEYRRKTGRVYLDTICNQLWKIPQINWDGAVLGCCRNYWGNFGGNAFTDGLLQAINNPKIRYARAMLLGRVPPREDIPCVTCEIYQARRPASEGSS